MEQTYETKMVGVAWKQIQHVHTNSLTVLATQAISNVVKSSFGPSGLDKMMVDDIGVSQETVDRFIVRVNSPQDVTVTNDGATILSLLDIEHPAGKILVDLAQQQDREVSLAKHPKSTSTKIEAYRLEMEQPRWFS